MSFCPLLEIYDQETQIHFVPMPEMHVGRQWTHKDVKNPQLEGVNQKVSHANKHLRAKNRFVYPIPT